MHGLKLAVEKRSSILVIGWMMACYLVGRPGPPWFENSQSKNFEKRSSETIDLIEALLRYAVLAGTGTDMLKAAGGRSVT